MRLLAQPSDLADWIGEPIEADEDMKRATLCLRIASVLVRDESGRTWEDGDIPDAAHMVTLYCASRVYENREAETQNGLDNYQASRKVVETGAYLTPSEKAMLASFNRPAHRGLGTVSTTKRETVRPSGWVPTDTPNVEFPWY